MKDTPETNAPDAAQVDAILAPGGAVAPETTQRRAGRRQPPAAWCAQALIAPVRASGLKGFLYAASSERRAAEIGRALRQFAPDIEVLVLPPWDCLPYDRASPSRECMGRRMAVLARLGAPATSPRVLIADVDALMQRVPPLSILPTAFRTFRVGDTLDRAALDAFAAATGYVADDRIDEPGEIAVLGTVVDIYPAAASMPVRIVLDEQDRIVELRAYDPLTQRTQEASEEVTVGPASELILSEGRSEGRAPGSEHRAPEIYGKMATVFDLVGGSAYGADTKAKARIKAFADQVAEAYDARRSLGADDGVRLLPPAKLYLTPALFRRKAAGRVQASLDGEAVQTITNFALERNPGRAFCDFVQARLQAGHRVVVAGMPHEVRALARAVKRGLNIAPASVDAWDTVLGAPGGALMAVAADVDTGFEQASTRIVLIAASDVLGGRLAARRAQGGTVQLTDPDLRLGDVVVHEDHGLGVLRGLEPVDVDGVGREALRLEYHGGAHLLVPIEEFDKVWRYGAEPEAVSLDRLHTDAWRERRVELSADIDRTAAQLVELARERASTKGPVIRPPKAAYARFAARFPYPETPDQAAAIDAVLEDLASGRVMSRLVCGDVGFGKTEVALRAAAAAALSGKQVAVVAPTTVLARQHFESFRRRFAGTGVRVARLSRLVSPSESQAVKAGLTDGSIGIVVGTHALGGADVSFADLGLLIIDEEQRFGARLKTRLRDLAPNAHLLTMTATPIPRTLQLAMVGVEDVSVIATPPARRRPIRTFFAPWDPATVRTALLRQHRRGGQSFVVAPRISDLDGLAEELGRLAPELTLRIAHGELPAEAADEVMVGFAAGEGDVLLATNIIESGLDVPGANTMLVWRADLFGLAQLHQLRGRVGRGRAQGIAYLLHDPDETPSEATRARLSTLEAFDRLGSGLSISARDLELRGAGDLVGDDQTGHLKLIGTALYQKLLTRAVEVAKGEISDLDWHPEVNVGITGAFPESYVPDVTVRINLYARLGRMTQPDEIEEFIEELEDRFGPPPQDVVGLVEVARLKSWARAASVRRIDAGPKGVALTPSGPITAPPAGYAVTDGRLVLHGDFAEPWTRLPDIRRGLASMCSAGALRQHTI
ncbi:MAG: DEAD/DEAH box helicase [Pseudomonadota bacterium]